MQFCWLLSCNHCIQELLLLDFALQKVIVEIWKSSICKSYTVVLKARFVVKVESRENPDLLRGKPSAVVQYNAWKGGGIIAVNYEARAAGVTR